ncbi:MAG: hypothetical protein ACRDXX_05440 [Stackebrandtia sp.]
MNTAEAPQAATQTSAEPAPQAWAAGEPAAVAAPPPPLLAATAASVARAKTVPDLRIRRLMGVSAWAVTLAVAGLPLGTIGMFVTMGDTPGWFEPLFIAAGVFGLILVIVSFVTIRYRYVPWILLGASTVMFVGGVVMLGSV